MLKSILECAGLGAAGIDFLTAAYILSAGVRSVKRRYITAFMLSFVFFSIVPAAVLSVTLGEIAVDYIGTVISENKDVLRAFIEIFILIALLWSAVNKLFIGKTEKKEKVIKSDGIFKSAAVGFLFAISAYTDPTYYAVIILASEPGGFLAAALLITLWLLISQFAAFGVYFSLRFNYLDRLTLFIDNFKQKHLAKIQRFLRIFLPAAAILILADTVAYFIGGNFLIFN